MTYLQWAGLAAFVFIAAGAIITESTKLITLAIGLGLLIGFAVYTDLFDD